METRLKAGDALTVTVVYALAAAKAYTTVTVSKRQTVMRAVLVFLVIDDSLPRWSVSGWRCGN